MRDETGSMDSKGKYGFGRTRHEGVKDNVEPVHVR